MAISTGRRYTFAKSLCRGLEVQRFPRPLVELTGDPVQLALRDRREVETFGEVMAHQAVGVFV
jgi:hypothetical protein